jgi:hypothetical protein
LARLQQLQNDNDQLRAQLRLRGMSSVNPYCKTCCS